MEIWRFKSEVLSPIAKEESYRRRMATKEAIATGIPRKEISHVKTPIWHKKTDGNEYPNYTKIGLKRVVACDLFFFIFRPSGLHLRVFDMLEGLFLNLKIMTPAEEQRVAATIKIGSMLIWLKKLEAIGDSQDAIKMVHIRIKEQEMVIVLACFDDPKCRYYANHDSHTLHKN